MGDLVLLVNGNEDRIAQGTIGARFVEVAGHILHELLLEIKPACIGGSDLWEST